MATQNVFVLLYLCGIIGCWADPCLNPMKVPSLEKRDGDYVLATGERAVNDRLLTQGWYDAEGKVFLDSPPGFQHCGTRYPIWRLQKNDNNSVMCIQSYRNTCIRKININTTMCGTKEIFHLKKTFSSSAYCFGSPDIPPTFAVKPTVTTQLHNYTYTSKLEFRCEFSKHDADVFYATNWVVNGDLVLTEDAMRWDNGDVIDNHTLTEAKLISVHITQVGFELRCSVRASFGADTAASVPVMSDSKFIGIKISNKSLELSEGEFADISLQLTAPFGCGTQGLGCELNIASIHLETTPDCAEADLTDSSCGTVILASEWDKAATIRVFGQVSQSLGLSSNTLKLKLAIPDVPIDNMFWENYTIGIITVQLKKNTTLIARKSCYAINDPHMLTFDGRRYEHQYEGVFTMYKHTIFPIEVQIQTADCGGGVYNAWCNCGVAIRAGRTVFEFNRCAGQSSIWTLEYTLCQDTGDVLQVKKNGNNYEVYLPTGGRVTVNVNGIYLNVYIYPSIQDVNSTRGLCGTLTANCRDDFFLRDGTYSTDVTATGDCGTTYNNWQNLLTTFSNSWKVSRGSNLFDQDDHASLSAWPQTNLYCSCSPDPTSNRSIGAVNCTAAIHKMCNTLPGFTEVFPTSCTITERRRRRSAGVQLESPRRLRRQVWRVLSNGWTEVKARAFCEKVFQKSRSVQVCKNVTGVDISGSIENCILDIQLTGTTDFFRFSVDTVRDNCLHEVLVDPELWVKSGKNNTSVYDIVVAEACLNDCSGKGTCTSGDCVCQTNYGGSDCSVDLTTPPRLADSDTVDTCDMSRDACGVISVKGETFVEGASRCLVEEIRVRKSGQEIVGSNIYMATVVNIGHAHCNIVTNDNTGSDDGEYVRAYRISIANTPGNYSDSVGLIVFNSICIRADGGQEANFNWTLKGPYCLDRGACVPHGSRQSGNNYLVCEVSANKGTWRNRSVPSFAEKPTVVPKLVRASVATSELKFLCEFNKHPDDVFYTTNWVVNGHLVLTEDPEKWDDGKVIDKHTLTEAKLISVNIKQVGFEVRCSVRASFGETTAASVPVLSDGKFIGIKISPRTLILSEGESADISLQLTAPFGCGDRTDNTCILPIVLQTDTSDLCAKGVLVSSAGCGTRVLYPTWNQLATIKVHGQVSQLYGSSLQTLQLELKTTGLPSHMFWANYNPGSITVHLKKDTSMIQRKSCYASNDPHMKTFDGRYYEHQHRGIFTMYKHNTLPIEVQIQTTSCGSYAKCNCGVAVRAGRTVFEFNRCPGQSSIWTIEYTLCEDSGNVLQVEEKGNKYEVYLPTGGRVTVYVARNTHFLNVYIYPSVLDVKNSGGLCGYLSDVCKDDFVLRDGTFFETGTDEYNSGNDLFGEYLLTFSKSWRVEDNNLFDPEVHESLSPWPHTNLFCYCSGNSQTVTEDATCSAAIYNVCYKLPGFTKVYPEKCAGKDRWPRRKFVSVDEEYGLSRNEDVGRSEWTEEAASEFCEKLFWESTSIKLCAEVAGVDVRGSIKNCILDIQLTGTTDFSHFSIDTVRDKCLHEVLVDPELRSLYDTVVSEACLNDCSGKGTCESGKCVCKTYFGGSDCSVDLTTSPRMTEPNTVDICDMSRDTCNAVSVEGEKFVEGISRCFVNEIRIGKSGQTFVGTNVHMAGVVDIGHALCKIVTNDNTESDDREYVRAYRISVANSDEDYSDSVVLIVFDGTCIRVDDDRESFKWTLKGPYCLDRGSCVPEGTRQSGNNYLVCEVADNKGIWKPRLEGKEMEEE